MLVQVLQQAMGVASKPAVQLQVLRAIRQDSQQPEQSSAFTAWQKACLTAVLPAAVAALHHTLDTRLHQQQLTTDELQASLMQARVAKYCCHVC